MLSVPSVLSGVSLSIWAGGLKASIASPVSRFPRNKMKAWQAETRTRIADFHLPIADFQLFTIDAPS